jgi:hypothetical protein
MKVICLVIGLFAGATLLFGLAAVVLIWASSEFSYLFQFALACVLLFGLFLLAKRGSSWFTAAGAAACAATITVAMPMEIRLPLQPSDDFRALAASWTLQFLLILIFTAGIRFYYKATRLSDRT